MSGDRSDPLSFVLGAVELAAGFDGARELEVHGAALSGQEVVVYDLAQERVPEAEASAVTGDKDVLGDGFAQRLAQLGVAHAGDARDQLLVQSATDGDGAHRPPCGIAEPLDPQHERVAQALRRRPATVKCGRHELLDVERVAVRAHQQAVDQVRGRCLTEDVGQRLRKLRVVERLQL